jgi:hypothetical protein
VHIFCILDWKSVKTQSVRISLQLYGSEFKGNIASIDYCSGTMNYYQAIAPTFNAIAKKIIYMTKETNSGWQVMSCESNTTCGQIGFYAKQSDPNIFGRTPWRSRIAGSGCGSG